MALMSLLQPIPEHCTAPDLIQEPSNIDIINSKDTTVRGVLFGRSIRSSFASFHLARRIFDDEGDDDDDDDNYEPLLVRMQFQNKSEVESLSNLRSFCRRFCKLGDLMTIVGNEWRTVEESTDTEWKAPRLVVDIVSTDHAKATLRVIQTRFWNIRSIQSWQKLYLDFSPPMQPVKTKMTIERAKRDSHGGAENKRQQGEYLTNFLLHMIDQKISQDKNKDAIDPSTWPTSLLSKQGTQAAVEYLNRGKGVIDAAGGSGHVSMALGLRGIRSTIIDPRENVGRLPGRDRKQWNRALRNNQKELNDLYCQPVIPFESYRAWIGKPPQVRHKDQADLPCCERSEFFSSYQAIVALHPDEATDDIVIAAIEHRLPFVIVPCCVFHRLFTHRRLPDGAPVSTYQDLLLYLQAKHPSIQRMQLPFEGANTILWSTFFQ